jgi:hypothetical protein
MYSRPMVCNMIALMCSRVVVVDSTSRASSDSYACVDDQGGGVHVFIPDVVHEGDTPQFGPWASPPFEDASANTVIFVVVVS